MSDFEPPQPPPPPGPPPLPDPDTPPAPGWWKASDGNWYPPQQAPAQQPQVPPPPGGYQQQGYQTYGQGYGAPGYQPYGVQPSNGMATAALVLGIASIVLFWSFGFGVLLGILAVIFGVLGGNRAKELPGEPQAGRAKAGLITGIIGIVGGVAFFIVIFAAVGDAIDDIDSDPSDGFCNPDRFLQDPDC